MSRYGPNWAPEQACPRPEFADQAAASSACAGSREGAAEPSSRAWQHAVSNSNTLRFCCRAVATTLSIRSTNRLPASLSVPPLSCVLKVPLKIFHEQYYLIFHEQYYLIFHEQYYFLFKVNLLPELNYLLMAEEPFGQMENNLFHPEFSI